MNTTRILRPFSLALAIAAGAILSFQGAAQAQSPWPNKPVRIIASFAPGGSSDLVARQLALHLTQHYGQQFIVENRAGASGNIGVDFVAKAAPDGYILGLGTSGPLANNKALFTSMPFDPEKDLTPIALVGEIPLLISVNPSVKANNLAEFVALSKSSTDPLLMAHPGNGTIGHLAIEFLSVNGGGKFRSVPYKGDTPALADTLAGTVQAVSVPVTSQIQHVQAGKLKALAFTSKTRFAGLPNVPTANEQGVPLEATVWSAMVGPAGLSPAIVQSLNSEINKYTASAEGKAKLASLGMTALGGTPAQLQELMRSEAGKWKQVAQSAKISLD
ncbi:Bug family tripartite tricarboxylate transporter substrate binding protein [Hydrogenophaga sp. BPS33]|uniref:Bug family tripartite tricarboxylate transporter substrate binding protein n=1 Tax=Hydrogenophaga sp. BPS33 TaxID=2651974 RepID=UPI00131FA2E9|nr:tripartite tricarboxylate transporter substrate binding protein [Hydrogenophaga sp. BPS33]QHE87271.1 tripartite tricarboxylate transporter substrate binding protein [Hydrogenophaga sp. BPS33]